MGVIPRPAPPEREDGGKGKKQGEEEGEGGESGRREREERKGGERGKGEISADLMELFHGDFS